MSATALLMGLLLLSYLGSLIVGGKAARGLPSGIEYLGLGFAVGPSALGLVERSMIAEFEPIVQVGLGWLAFVVGLDFGRAEGRRVRSGSLALGVAGAALTGVVVATAAWLALERLAVPGLERGGALLFAVASGAVCAETTPAAVRWVAARWTARGPVTNLLVELASADDFVPLVTAGVLFAFEPASGLDVSLPVYGWFAASLGLAALLGTVTALLLRGAEGYAVWGALFGTLLLGVGSAARFGMCTIFVTFVMGIALAGVSPNRRSLRRMVRPTERAVLYPMLLLAGARLDVRPVLESRALLAFVAIVLLARILGKLASGAVVNVAVRAARPAGPALGVVLLASGPVSTSVAFVFALRFPGPIGDTLLVLAAGSSVLGELVSTLALRRLLAHAGEVPEVAA